MPRTFSLVVVRKTRIIYNQTMEERLYITGPRMVPNKGKQDYLPLLKELMSSTELCPPFALFGGPFSFLSPIVCAQMLRTLTPPAPGAPELLMVTDDYAALLPLIRELSGQRDLCLFTDEIELKDGDYGQLACYSLLEPVDIIVEQCNCPCATKLFVQKHGFEQIVDELDLGLLVLELALVFSGLEDLNGTAIYRLLGQTFGDNLVTGVHSSRVLWEMAKDARDDH